MIAIGVKYLRVPSIKFLSYCEKKGVANFKKKFKADTDKILEKVKAKKTVSEVKNANSFLKDSIDNSDFKQKFTQNAQSDVEFREFLKSFNERHKEFPNITDVSHYLQTQDMFQKTPEMRKDELMMLDEFRARRKEREGFLNKETSKNPLEQDENDLSDDEFDEYGIFKELEKQKGLKYETMKPEFTMDENFRIILLSQGTTTLVTTLNRINYFRVLLFCGNMNGIIGFAKGKARDQEGAMLKAMNNLKRNLIAIPLDHLNSMPLNITAKYEGVKLILKHKSHFDSWGSQVMANMLMLSGITETKFKLIVTTRNPYAMVYCFFKAVTQNVTPKMLSEERGIKLYTQYIGRPRQPVHNP
mmetsp:Transcript_64462/g.74933  ORF Transcript_64462/g.74933 Transcript_64462/m.74933 type:complete len:358 (+) Transcript_64462:17-1090(+)